MCSLMYLAHVPCPRTARPPRPAPARTPRNNRDSVVEGEPEIDTSLVDSTCKIDEYVEVAPQSPMLSATITHVERHNHLC